MKEKKRPPMESLTVRLSAKKLEDLSQLAGLWQCSLEKALMRLINRGFLEHKRTLMVATATELTRAKQERMDSELRVEMERYAAELAARPDPLYELVAEMRLD